MVQTLDNHSKALITIFLDHKYTSSLGIVKKKKRIKRVIHPLVYMKSQISDFIFLFQ